MEMQGFLRQPQVLELLPVSPATWWRGIKEGRYPAPVKLGPKMSAWRAQDIKALIDELAGETASPKAKKGGAK